MTPPLSIAIVTSCAGYGKYLGEWAQSIARLDRKPAMVGIVAHGSEADQRAAFAAMVVIEAAGIPCQVRWEAALLDFGEARNRAVALADTEWVMHLDADDMLMPHALDDVAALAPSADVVALGYERVGDLAAGPRQRSKLYQSSTGEGVLRNPTPASGVSPFRRSFWERSPYRTDLIGGWDTALWLGFGHLGARIVATARPCFWYRQHADSVFNTRRLDSWATARAGGKFSSLRRGDHGVSILVPRGVGDGPEREAAWRWVRRRYQALYPDWEIAEGQSHASAWRKGDAVNDALSRAHGAILVIADADCVLPAEALKTAVAAVQGGVPWVVPHQLVHRLTPSQTANWLAAAPDAECTPPTEDLDRPPYPGFAGGGVLVIARTDYVATGGIPREFCGWGFEDEALATILDTMLGSHQRLDHPLVHLWHPLADKRVGRTNRPLYHSLMRARGDPAALWNLIRPDRQVTTHPSVDFEARRLARLAQRTEARARIQEAAEATARARAARAPEISPRLRETERQAEHRANIARARARSATVNQRA